MSGGHHIRAVGRGTSPRAPQDEVARTAQGGSAPEDDDALLLENEAEEPEEPEEGEAATFASETPSRGWLAPTIAVAVVIAWTALFGWAMRAEFAAARSAAPSEWTSWIIDWSVPVLLIGIVWLIAMGNSRSEAKRFASTAAMLRRESEELEGRLSVVNRELSLAREFLASQSRELESLGRIASERLSNHAGELQDLIHDNGAQVDSIHTASETALANMNRLRDDLPVIATSARDVTNQVGSAGRTAKAQLDELVAGFERLNQFGSASANQVAAIGKRVSETLESFESKLTDIETLVSGRFETLKQETGAFRDSLSQDEANTLRALQDRIAALREESDSAASQLREAEDSAVARLRQSKERLHDEIAETIATIEGIDRQAMQTAQQRLKELTKEATRFDERLAVRDRRFMEEMQRRQDEFETRESQASEVLAQRLADLDEAIAQRREAQIAETGKLVQHGREIAEQLQQLSSLMSEIAAQGDTTRESLGEGLGKLGEDLAARRSELSETQAQLTDLTEAGVRLLEIIQSGARHAREDLPAAIETASATLSSVEERADKVGSMMLTAANRGDDLSDYLVTTQSQIDATDASIGNLAQRLAEQSDDTLARLQGLRGGFERLSQEAEALGGETQDRLRAAIEELREATATAFATIDDGARERLTRLGGEMGGEAVDALERALRSESAETIGKLEQSAAHASGVGREAAIQLRDQLAKVNELAGNLEQRVARAREQAEEQVNNDFARRMALITDSLNSASIDIASALSTEVTDTAWDAYLKGDRGIFTRRAVRLVDSGKAREIADLYQNDETFRASVSRYIHDFEAMLRAMLSTRDGNALGVTVLGSDAGKLYVTLAQAIQRFRD